MTVLVFPTSEEIEAAQCERSLMRFARLMWPVMDPAPFVDNWHLGVIAEHLEAVTHGQIQRLIINIPPRHTKSLTVGVAWPAWTWTLPSRGRPNAGPQVQFLTSSYAHPLSIRDAVKTRRVMNSMLYQRYWGERFALTSDQNAKQRYENDVGGYRLATSVDSGLTGEGGQIIVIDDPHNVREAESETEREAVITWWRESMSTRLNDPQTGAYVIIMQRVHERDLVGHILAKEAENNWTHLCIPARYDHGHPYSYAKDPRTDDGAVLWPARLPEAELKKLETTMGPYGVAGQMQQLPAPREGGMFQKAWFPVVDAIPAGSVACRGWDFAATEKTATNNPDWTAHGKIYKTKEGRYIIAHVEMFQGSEGKVEQALKNYASQDGKNCVVAIPQDPGQAGKSQVAYLTRGLGGYVVRSSPETGSKTTRAAPMAAQAEAGNVACLAGDWVAPFLERLAMFPNGATDDEADACSRAFNTLNETALPTLVAPVTTPVVSPFAV